MPTPFLSVVICTRNRAEALPDALACYERMVTELPWELVVVDNGSSDGTRAVLDAFAASAPFPMRVLTEPRTGLSRARNTGWRAARGPVIVFTDDDCYPEPEFLAEVGRHFVTPGVDYLGGRILLFDEEDHPITIQTRETPALISPRSFVPTGLIQGANMSARRSVLEAVGGFDEMLGAGMPWCSEDIDFVSRASAAGFTGVYEPGPLVLHHHRRQTKRQIRAVSRAYDIGRGAYYMKCMLDPARRAGCWPAWWSGLRANLAEAQHSRRAAFRILWELEGAFGYLGARLVHRPGPVA
jgi:glycosyltransferase involved in cell wall biosynthesis